MTVCRIRWAAWALMLSAVGCQPQDEVRSYTVPKEAALPAVHAASTESAEPTDRMLVAILPDGQQAWFLKVVGPLAEVAHRADEITKFFESVRAAPGKPHPDWQLPNDWQQQEGTGMRAATITIPSGGESLEMTVTTLGWSGNQDELLANVNRWRRQMQLTPIGVVALADCTRELTAGDATLTIVDLTGTMGATGMTPPFAQQAGSSSTPPGESASAGGGSLPAGHPPIGASRPAPSANLTFDTPESWQTLPATGIRKAAFSVGEGEVTALVTVMDFPTAAGPMITDVLENVNRWRLELGLAKLREDQLASVTEGIELSGLDGTLVDLIPDSSEPAESHADEGTLAAMVTRGDTIWFFKLKGNGDLVAAERENFQFFVKSVRFAEDEGADDGN